MHTDLTFITNEGNKNLLDRFNVLIKDTRFFDVLVGYFYTSGFFAVYKSLENTEKIRILVGISANRETFNLIQKSQMPLSQQNLEFSYAEAKEKFSESLESEMDNSEDNAKTEEGVYKFLEWLKSGKLEIKAYPAENIHAKLYIMSFAEGDRDVGRIITGSSNFTLAGFKENLEFNVELKNKSDYDFALKKFNELWENSVDLKEKYIETIRTKTWLNDTVTPYELYLKFLYEYFKEKINIDLQDIRDKYLPENFLDLEYQSEAVKDAKSKLEQYGGVFVSDVVGLGKTYISAMLAQQLKGRHLVIAPPILLDKENPGSWPNVFSDFKEHADFESWGQLDKIIARGTDKYQNVFIDESHRFRTESNITYEKLAQICRGKRVILVTATPLNNRPKDILAQIKLFQKVKKSTIPGMPDLERFFSHLEGRLKNLDRQRDYSRFISITKENAKEIREKVLKHLMVRRTRSEIERYFADDLKNQKLKFPEVADPKPVFYELDDNEDRIFNATIELIAQKLKYVRYTPLLYYTGEKIKQPERLAQENMGKLMEIILIKRLESSFYAFKESIRRFINSYEHFLQEFEKGDVYMSKKYINKIFELLEEGNYEEIESLIEEDKAQKYNAADFSKEFKNNLEHDLEIFKSIDKMWKTINRDPKLLKFIAQLKSEKIFKENKIIVFTESKETAQYLEKNLEEHFKGEALAFSGASSAAAKQKIIENFDAKARFPKDDYRILISTEVLSEGVNLHRSNVVINYDIPWNPTRLMQRVGRINRVDTKFDTIYSYNFFPTKQSNDQIKLKEAAEAKIHSFISMLGTDAMLLTDGEPIESFELFTRLTSKQTITGEGEEEESELKYLEVIRDIRDNDLELFDKIKKIPKKARSAKKYPPNNGALITYFRKGKLQKFYISDKKISSELDFFSAAKIFESKAEDIREKLGKDFYELLDKNKKEFEFATIDDMPDAKLRGGRDSASYVVRILKANEIKHFKGFTEDDEEYIRSVIKELEEGGLPKQTSKTLKEKFAEELKKGVNPLKLLGILRTNIASEFFKETIAESSAQTYGPREVILSEYLTED
ncbi:MAG: helicase [Armatimonadetes bacterium]|nr:helicase [Armatimonadota bacterium]